MEEPFARYFERKQLLVGAETGCLRSMQAAFTLIQADADVDQEDGRGASGLLLAAQNGHKKVARLLLQEGADEAKVTSCGFTPLAAALENGHPEIVELLKHLTGCQGCMILAFQDLGFMA
mmetsp:Transcript_27618/g.64925  ORF Transcript_27618/g.64925 Transcript_27618/m.64925 type:complete len:120 (+) Transcript_27618:180-539(+)